MVALHVPLWTQAREQWCRSYVLILVYYGGSHAWPSTGDWMLLNLHCNSEASALPSVRENPIYIQIHTLAIVSCNKTAISHSTKYIENNISHQQYLYWWKCFNIRCWIICFTFCYVLLVAMQCDDGLDAVDVRMDVVCGVGVGVGMGVDWA